LRQQLKL